MVNPSGLEPWRVQTWVRQRAALPLLSLLLLGSLGSGDPCLALEENAPCRFTLQNWAPSAPGKEPKSGLGHWTAPSSRKTLGRNSLSLWWRLDWKACPLVAPTLVIRQLYDGEIQIFQPGAEELLQTLSTYAPLPALASGRSWLGWPIPRELGSQELWLKVTQRRQIPIALQVLEWDVFLRADALRTRFFFGTIVALVLFGLVAAVFAQALGRSLLLYLAGWSLTSAYYWFFFSGEAHLLPGVSSHIPVVFSSVSLALSLGIFLGSRFARLFLALPQQLPLLAQTHSVFLVLLAVVAPIHALWYDLPLVNLAQNANYLALNTLQLVGAWLRIRQGSLEAPFYLLGWGPLQGVSLIQIFYFVTFQPNPLWLDYAFPGAFLMASVVLLVPTARAARYAETEMHQARSRARVDGLTGLLNRATVLEELKRVLEASHSSGKPCSLLILDLDRFKQINDHFGHAVGDACLRLVAEILQAHVRASDPVGRYGGEEILLVCPHCEAEQAVRIAEALRTLIERHGQTVSGKPVRLTTSVGIAVSQPHETLESLFQRADRALYEAKHLGRNRTMVAPVAPKVVSVGVPLS